MVISKIRPALNHALRVFNEDQCYHRSSWLRGFENTLWGRHDCFEMLPDSRRFTASPAGYEKDCACEEEPLRGCGTALEVTVKSLGCRMCPCVWWAEVTWPRYRFGGSCVRVNIYLWYVGSLRSEFMHLWWLFCSEIAGCLAKSLNAQKSRRLCKWLVSNGICSMKR